MAKFPSLWALVPPRFVLQLATLGPLGMRLKAPGTWGSLAGLLWYTLFFHPLGETGLIILAVLTSLLAVGICGQAENILRRRDPGEVILDEMVAIPFCFLGVMPILASGGEPRYWVVGLLAFGLFRFFDILKPLGITKLQEFNGGWGVVLDDIAAALATCLCLHLLIRFLPVIFWS